MASSSTVSSSRRNPQSPLGHGSKDFECLKLELNFSAWGCFAPIFQAFRSIQPAKSCQIRPTQHQSATCCHKPQPKRPSNILRRPAPLPLLSAGATCGSPSFVAVRFRIGPGPHCGPKIGGPRLVVATSCNNFATH